MFTRADASRHYYGGKKVIFTGKPHSGKDTCANILIDEYGYQKVAFATPVKLAVAELMGWDDPESNKDEWITNAADGTHLSKRDIWREVAEKFVKPLFGQAFFAQRALSAITFMPVEQDIVITDLRFPVEAETFASLSNVVFIEVKREYQCMEQGIHGHDVENHDLSPYIQYSISAPSGLSPIALNAVFRAQLTTILGLEASCK